MPPIKKQNRDGEMFNVNGLSVKESAVYKIENRYDPTAPTGFQRHNATKLPSSDVGNSVQIPFVVTNKATGDGIWDTGFFEKSPCYAGMPPAAVKERVKALRTHIVEPYEKLKGKEGLLEHSNDEFWSSFTVDLWAGRYLSTDDPIHLLDLYAAMQAGELAVESDQGNPRYNQADFIIIDKVKERSAKQSRAVASVTASGRFFALLQENPQKLLVMLRYVGVTNVTNKIDSDVLMTLFTQWLDMGDKNAENFVKLLDECENKSFEEAVYMYTTLKNMFERGRAITKNTMGDYVYNGHPLGKDLKHVAKNLVMSPDLSEIKAQILEEADAKKVKN